MNSRTDKREVSMSPSLAKEGQRVKWCWLIHSGQQAWLPQPPSVIFIRRLRSKQNAIAPVPVQPTYSNLESHYNTIESKRELTWNSAVKPNSLETVGADTIAVHHTQMMQRRLSEPRRPQGNAKSNNSHKVPKYTPSIRLTDYWIPRSKTVHTISSMPCRFFGPS